MSDFISILADLAGIAGLIIVLYDRRRKRDKG